MTDSLWNAATAAVATNGHTSSDWVANGVSIDSRTVAAGDLFVALKGPVFDGHDFVAKAFEAGAAAAMVHRPLNTSGALLTVDDTMAGLEALGRAARARCDGKMIAVTGSVGKTGSKDGLSTILARQGTAHATVGNLNNHWGVPLSLARLPESADFGVFELAMSRAGELDSLSRMVRPHVGLITTVAPAHVEFFDSIEAVAEAKAEIFVGVERGGSVVLPRDNDHYALLDARARDAGVDRRVTFGAHPDSDVQLLTSLMDSDGSDVTASVFGRPTSFRIGTPGHHWIINALGLLAVIQEAGAALDAAAMAMLKPLAGRGERQRIDMAGGSFDLIDESYNASPAAMRAVFETLMLANPRDGGRRIAVLGDMRELGSDGPALHAALAKDLVDANIDRLFAAGPLMRHLYDAVPNTVRGAHTTDSATLLPFVVEAVQPGDVVCVKGSLGSQMKPIVHALAALGRDEARENQNAA